MLQDGRQWADSDTSQRVGRGNEEVDHILLLYLTLLRYINPMELKGANARLTGGAIDRKTQWCH